MAIDIEINILRGWSTTLSTNSSRTLSVYSNISSTIYTKQIQIYTNNSTVRIGNNELSSYFIFLSFFSFIFSYLIENKIKKTKCDTVTGHMIWSQKSLNHVIQR